MQYRYDYKGETHSIRLEKQPDGSYTATIGEKILSFKATQHKDGTWLIDDDHTRTVIHTARDGENRYVQVDGEHYTLSVTNLRRRGSQASSTPEDLVSEMPGQVIEVRAKEGDSVRRGDVLVVLEAMKMEIRMTAPHDGIVARLLVAQGDIVDRGQLLAEVKASEDA